LDPVVVDIDGVSLVESEGNAWFPVFGFWALESRGVKVAEVMSVPMESVQVWRGSSANMVCSANYQRKNFK
jgi:hypothetical protein